MPIHGVDQKPGEPKPKEAYNKEEFDQEQQEKENQAQQLEEVKQHHYPSYAAQQAKPRAGPQWFFTLIL